MSRRSTLVCLDLDDQYSLDDHCSGFVDRFMASGKSDDTEFCDDTGGAPRDFALHAWRGSYLRLMRALEDAADGVDAPRLVVHLPGGTEDGVRATPQLELYAVTGTRYRKALPTGGDDTEVGAPQPPGVNATAASRTGSRPTA